MKMKKLLALALSAIMAVSMLTACGGGGESGSMIGISSGNKLDMDRVNAYIAASGSNVIVKNSGVLNGALKATVAWAGPAYSLGSTTNISRKLRNDIRKYPITDTNTITGWYSYTDGAAMSISENDLLNSGKSLDEVAADFVLEAAANPDYTKHANRGAQMSWSVSAMRGTDERYDKNYWIIVYEVTIEGYTK